MQRDPSDYNPITQYNPLGVGAPEPGLLHPRIGPLTANLGLGEANLRMPLGGGLTGEAGYQYGSNAFLGVGGQNWSSRLGYNPGSGMMSAGLGIGSPLLPMPSTLTSSVNGGYAGLGNGSIAPALGAAGDLAAVAGHNPTSPFGFGLNAGYNPTDGAGYVGAGFQYNF